MTVAYLGPEDSYSHLAAKKMIPQGVLKAYGSFPLIFNALACGAADCAVVPVENSLNGEVTQNIDLWQASENIHAVGECLIRVEHRLATLKGTDGIKRIYSHSQALEQCAQYLFKNFPNAKLIAVPSTSASVEMIKTEEDAGIVGAHISRKGIVVSKQNIADCGENYTRFVKLVKSDIDEHMHTRKIYFSVTCPNVSGGLLRLLQCISEEGLNMSKLQSRPVKGKLDEFRFFIETEGDYASVKNGLARIGRAALSFKLLGAY